MPAWEAEGDIVNCPSRFRNPDPRDFDVVPSSAHGPNLVNSSGFAEDCAGVARKALTLTLTRSFSEGSVGEPAR